MKTRIGVCSWSLQPTSPADLVAKVKACGLSRVQLALNPLQRGDWDEGETVAALAAGEIELESGMLQTHGEDYTSLVTIRETGGVRQDRYWRKNIEAARETALLAQRLGLGLVTFHAGFLPEDPADPERIKMIRRLREFCEIFSAVDVKLGLETGQESASTLLEVLQDLDHPAAGVNFDPANMVLYGMGEPQAALEELREHVLQIHIKDAQPSNHRDEWGLEVRVGSGAVNWPPFVALARKLGVALMIEREAGEQRVADITAARKLILSCLESGA